MPEDVGRNNLDLRCLWSYTHNERHTGEAEFHACRPTDPPDSSVPPLHGVDVQSPIMARFRPMCTESRQDASVDWGELVKVEEGKYSIAELVDWFRKKVLVVNSEYQRGGRLWPPAAKELLH